MKSRVLLLALVLVASVARSQDNGIVYTNFDPDLSVSALVFDDPIDTIKVDLDQDGTADFKMYIATRKFYRDVYVTSSWDFRYCYNSIHCPYGVYENDTIVPYPSGWSAANESWSFLWWNPIAINLGTYMEFMMGFHKTIDSHNYYAWARIYMYCNPDGYGHDPIHGEYDMVYAYCDQMAYCTIPDYPLMWGQTELWGLEENEASNFATVHPNPTTGMVSITGENLRKAEITNMLGQHVVTASSQGGQLSVDISRLPAGVYFVSVTDESGKKCVRKVVKE